VDKAFIAKQTYTRKAKARQTILIKEDNTSAYSMKLALAEKLARKVSQVSADMQAEQQRQ
jgi:hypothetical protein